MPEIPQADCIYVSAFFLYAAVAMRQVFCLIGSALAMSPDEACSFVGVRYAAMPAVCELEMCTGLMLFNGSKVVTGTQLPYVPLHCRTAVAMTTELMAAAEPAPPLSTILETLERVAVDIGTEALVMDAGLDADALHIMHQLNEDVWRRAASDWVAWRETGSLELAQSWAFQELTKLVTDLIRNSLAHPLWHRTDSGLLTPMMRLLVDVASLLNRDVFLSIMPIRDILESPFLHALLETGPHILRTPFPMNTEVVLELAAAFSEIQSPEKVMRIARSFQSWHPNRSSNSSVEGLLLSVIDEHVCTRLGETFSSLIHTAGSTHIAAKLGVSITHVCRSTSAGVVKEHWRFARSLNGLPHDRPGIHFIDQARYFAASEGPDGLDHFVFSESLFAFASEYIGKSGVLVPGPRFNRLASTDELPLEELQEVMIGLGRLIGLVIRYGVTFPDLNLAPSLVCVAHMDNRHAPADSRAFLEEIGITGRDDEESVPDWKELIAKYAFQPTFWLRNGVGDSVGPAGPEVLTSAAWEAFLMPPT